MELDIKMKKIKIPVFIDDTWFCCFLGKNGKTKKSSNTGHKDENGCLICCQGYNKSIGYLKKDVAKIISKIKDGKKREKEEKK